MYLCNNKAENKLFVVQLFPIAAGHSGQVFAQNLSVSTFPLTRITVGYANPHGYNDGRMRTENHTTYLMIALLSSVGSVMQWDKIVFVLRSCTL